MATAFSDLHGYLRAVLGDLRSECYLYTEDELNSQFRLTILFLNNTEIQEDGTTAIFTDDLTNVEKLKVVLQSAYNVLNPQPELFKHASPILKIERRTSREMIRELKNKLDALNGGKFGFASDTEFMALLNSLTRYYDDLTAAL